MSKVQVLLSLKGRHRQKKSFMLMKLISIICSVFLQLIDFYLSNISVSFFWKFLKRFITTKKFILMCFVVQFLFSLLIIKDLELFRTNALSYFVGTGLPTFTPIAFFSLMLFNTQLFYPDFKNYNLMSFLFTMLYIFSVLLLGALTYWFANHMYVFMSICPLIDFNFPAEFNQPGTIHLSKVTTTDLTLSHLIITDNSAKTIIYFDSLLKFYIENNWPDGFSKNLFIYLTNNLLLEITLLKN
jgi:hypothetical protein